MSLVLDASALLAFLHDEPGGEQVSTALDGARVSAVNWSEVLQKSLQRKADIDGMRQEFSEVGVAFEPFSLEQAEIAAHLWADTKGHGLSLADRSCLALALDKRLPVMTADRRWGELGLDLDIRLLR
jgi:PIN domain nuclease of toxin-antitoxin system